MLWIYTVSAWTKKQKNKKTIKSFGKIPHPWILWEEKKEQRTRYNKVVLDTPKFKISRDMLDDKAEESSKKEQNDQKTNRKEGRKS